MNETAIFVTVPMAIPVFLKSSGKISGPIAQTMGPSPSENEKTNRVANKEVWNEMLTNIKVKAVET